MTHDTQQPAGQPLLGLRSAIVLLLGVLTGTGAGVLAYLAQRSLPGAALARAGAGFGAGVMFFHAIIG
ncbi:hypothetical protein [Streptomyces sp. S063]|uniref:hypothetical protein n=1 Tax=Streptomyces sp. S063 TaxID=2005885 RepID=UPI0010081EEC|nr:hypothetical protein [Streptomyces sp. S063]